MMAERIRLPASYGGILAYYDEQASKIQLKPISIIIASIILIAIVWILNLI